jgi:succinate dehydrogenase / fumarate reductase cytochrome b subunit
VTTTKPAADRRAHRRTGYWLIDFYRSDVGKKWIMALTGIVLLGFILFHMMGNLKVYLGLVEHEGELVQDIDIYGEWLRELLVPLFPRTFFLWVLRIGLIIAFVVHIQAAYSLSFRNRQARGPVRYDADQRFVAANYASRTMAYTGTIVLLFLIFHLADLTWGTQPAAADVWERGAVYANLVASFSRWPVALFYILANIALGFHIWHGTWSLFQSLGINNPRFNQWRRWFATAFTVVVIGGNLSFPIAVQTGIVGGNGFLA